MNFYFTPWVRFGSSWIAFVAVTVLSIHGAEPLTEMGRERLKKAEAGDAWAQYEMGLFTEDNDEEASKWFLRSANQGEELAMAIIGARFIRGLGVEKDLIEGARWQVKAFEKERALVLDHGVDIGEIDSTINDRYVVQHGTAEQRDMFTRAKAGELAAMVELARRLVSAEGVLLDTARAKQLLLDAVAKDYAPAFAMLGDYMRSVENDGEEAAKLYLKGAQRGVASAQFGLGELYDYGHGVEEDKATAKVWYRKAAEAGYGPAMMKEAEFAYAEKDIANATAWATKAEKANAEGAGELLSRIAAAKAKAVADEEAAKVAAAIDAQIPAGLNDEERDWMRKAIAGDASYQHLVGLAFQSGRSFPRDNEQMLKWFTLSAEAGNREAQVHLGTLYHFGLFDVAPDRAAAEKWLARAAATGDEEAVYWLARFYAEEPAKRSLAREMLGKLTLGKAREHLAKMDQQDNPDKAPPVIAPALDVKKEKAAQAISAASAELTRAMQASASPEQREKAVEEFSKAVGNHYAEAGMTRPQVEDFVLQSLVPFMEQRRDEALRHVNAIYSTVFDQAALLRVLPAPLLDAIRTQAQRAVAEYQAEQKRWEPVRALMPEAEAGDLNAMAALAAGYLEGPGGVERNWENAMKWVNKVRERNSDAANATHNKVSAYVNEQSQRLLNGEDVSAAIAFLERVGAVFEFNAANCDRLGVLHASPKKGHTPDYAKAVQWFERAAGLGSVESMMSLGHLHVAHEDHPVDEGVALKWFQHAAAKSNVEAQQWVELLQSSGNADARAAGAKKIVDDQRYAKAREKPRGPNQINEWQLLRYASHLGNGDAMAILGVEGLVFGEPETVAAGLKWLKKAEALGNAWGLRSLGLVYLHGMGVETDVPLALDYFARAADLGNADAAESIGQYWREQKDWEKAEKAWLRAAFMGSVTAQVRLAELAEEGAHRPQNLAEAIRLWEEIAALEDNYNGYAMYRLGLIHREGRGVAKDETIAREWMRKGAEAGWPDAKKEWARISGLSNAPAPLAALPTADDTTGLRKFRPWTFAEIKGELARGTDQVQLGIALGQDRAELTREGIFGQIEELKQIVGGPLKMALAATLSDIAIKNSRANGAPAAGTDAQAQQQSEAKNSIDAAASGAQPGVTVITIPGADQAITAVRYFGGWYVAIGAATTVDGVFKSKVWFSRDARNWEHRFTAGSPLEDVAYARSPFGSETFLLVLSHNSRFGATGETTTWCFRTDDNTWAEVRGVGARQPVATVGTKFVLSGQRREGNATIDAVSVSWLPTDWPATDVFAKFKSTQPPPRWDGGQMFDGRVYKSVSHPSAKWAILSSADLKNWPEDCLIPAAAAGQEHETEPQLCASEEMFLAGTMVAMGKGPVRFYRRKLSSEGWERITPNPSWNYLHGLSYSGGRFVAVASREDLRVSKDGLRWKVVADVRPYSPRFAVSPEGSYVFGGLDGAIAIVTPDKSWDDFSTVAEPTIQTGANW